MAKNGIRLVAAAGSVRPGNFTSMALAVVADEIRKHSEVTVEVLDLASAKLPFPGQTPTEDAQRIQRHVSEATGVILATPEYHGTFSSVMKLLIENLGFPSVLAGKPVALIGVAAGQLGAVKSLEHLRSVCSHIGAIVLPGTVSVAGVQQLFDEQGRILDAATEKRIRSVAGQMLNYIHTNICPRMALEEYARSGSTEWMARLAGSRPRAS